MDNHEEREYLFWLCHVPSLGAVKIKKLYDYIGGYKRIYNIEGKELERSGLLNQTEASLFENMKIEIDGCKSELADLENRGIHFITPYDREYPKRLLKIYGYPMGIFVKGKVPEDDRPAAAIIGARNCTNYGKQMASSLAAELSGAGIQIISGLAWGIDGAGHLGALKAGGDTYGVLGCGINLCYPKENFGLYQRMVDQGGNHYRVFAQ